MTNNQAMTAAAVAFAGFALWWTFRRTPGGALADRPAQQEREASLGTFWGILNSQSSQLTAALPASQNQTKSLTGAPVWAASLVPGIAPTYVY